MLPPLFILENTVGKWGGSRFLSSLKLNKKNLSLGPFHSPRLCWAALTHPCCTVNLDRRSTEQRCSEPVQRTARDNSRWAMSHAGSTKHGRFTSSWMPSPVLPQKGSIHPYNVTECYFHIKQPRAVLLSKGSMASLSKAKCDVPPADKMHGSISRCEAAGAAMLLWSHIWWSCPSRQMLLDSFRAKCPLRKKIDTKHKMDAT